MTDAITQSVSFLFGLLVLGILLVIAYRDHLTIYVLWVPVIAAVQFVFTLGFTFILAAITVFYRDVGIVIGHFLRLLFWISPILLVVHRSGRPRPGPRAGHDGGGQVPQPAHRDALRVLRFNPMSLLLESYRQVIYGHLVATEVGPRQTELSWTAATAPDLGVLLAIFVSGLVFLVIGTLIFKRLEPAFAKVL